MARGSLRMCVSVRKALALSTYVWNYKKCDLTLSLATGSMRGAQNGWASRHDNKPSRVGEVRWLIRRDGLDYT